MHDHIDGRTVALDTGEWRGRDPNRFDACPYRDDSRVATRTGTAPERAARWHDGCALRVVCREAGECRVCDAPPIRPGIAAV